MIDFIEDIHGYADELTSLLKELGYTAKNGSYSHPESKALFVGDYIDRGPKIREALDIVRRCDRQLQLHNFRQLRIHSFRQQ